RAVGCELSTVNYRHSLQHHTRLCHTFALRAPLIFQIPLLFCLGVPALAGQAAARALTTGEAIYHAGCAGCHGSGGQGAPDTTVGFEKPDTFPDFKACASTT